MRSLSLSTPITFRTKDGFCPLLPGVKAWPLGPQPDYGQSEVGVVGVVCLYVTHALLQVDQTFPSPIFSDQAPGRVTSEVGLVDVLPVITM